MPHRLFIGLIISVLLAAGLTVWVASSVTTPHAGWIAVPLGLALIVRIWSKSRR